MEERKKKTQTERPTDSGQEEGVTVDRQTEEQGQTWRGEETDIIVKIKKFEREREIVQKRGKSRGRPDACPKKRDGGKIVSQFFGINDFRFSI